MRRVFARVALPEFDAANEKAGKEVDEKTGERESKEAGKETGERKNKEASKEDESEKEVSESPNRASALAELAALAENVERCRERIVALAESQRLATYDPKKPENDDGLLMAIYEAERGLINAVRLLQRAARSR
jgi:hypothetical protein